MKPKGKPLQILTWMLVVIASLGLAYAAAFGARRLLAVSRYLVARPDTGRVASVIRRCQEAELAACPPPFSAISAPY